MILASDDDVIMICYSNNINNVYLINLGLYRVNYDDHNWEMIASYLRSSNRERIHKLNRAQVIIGIY